MAQRLMAVLALLAAGSAAAQPLSDPTRPATAPTKSPRSEAPASRLQSVLISPGRKLAVIDGQTVMLGGRVGNATVVAIAPAQVVLQSRDGTQTLKLHPAIEKTP